MIAQMGEIFQQAQEVVVGLGQESDGDERAIKALTELAALCPTSELSISDESNDKGRRFRELVVGLDREGAWPSILGLFRDPWFIGSETSQTFYLSSTHFPNSLISNSIYLGPYNIYSRRRT
jgi:hypothetical protein